MPDPAADFVERTGLLFRSGDYKDKDFSITPEELAAAAAGFSAPVPVDLSHGPTILDGRMGKLIKLEVRGDELYGTTRWSRAFDDLLAGLRLKVSLLWDRDTKNIRRLSLVPNPRIADAALFAAFAAAGGCLGAAEGCSCSSCSPAAPGRSDMSEMKDWIRKLKDVFKSDTVNEDDVIDIISDGLEAEGDGEGTPEPVTATATPAPVPAFSETPEYRAMLSRIEKAEGRAAKAEGQAETERKARVKSEAAAFAADEVRACRALPAERTNLEAAFAQAADDDHAHGGEVAFSAGGTAAKGSRVAMLRALQAARSPHVLTHELVGLHEAGSPGVDASGATVLFSGGSEETDEEIRRMNDEWAVSRPYLKKKGAAGA